MVTLELVRHGKASPSGADYDVLSELGARQSSALGRRLAELGTRFNRVFVGPLARHVDTFRAMLGEARALGSGWPDPERLPELDEAPLVALLRGSLMERLATDTELQRLVAEMSTPEAISRGDHRLRPVLRHMAELWMRNEISQTGVESYESFGARIRLALAALVSAGAPGQRVLVVSSVGAISELVRQALAQSEREAVDRLDLIPNASVTELVHDDAGFRLTRLGDVSHLETAELLTYL